MKKFVECESKHTKNKKNEVILPPRPKNGVLRINVTFVLLDISSVDIRNMDFQVMFRLRQMWSIHRNTCETYKNKLKNEKADKKVNENYDEDIFVSPKLIKHLWWPDTHFPNAKLIDSPSSVVNFNKMKLKSHYYRGCTVEHNSLSIATMACPMNLRHYPMDVQLCHINMRSCKYN
ncbi:glycine receptor subunit alpha-2-like protein [Leptotrombidium deliense]|uniref:Glycine receptor subunit alpha-2-like protein n=1 Tax=Leptotrombidium deliense TaxID=299467 RepID=A0A443SNG0_9ACAR|nr:glycine receptor subunit alpha-2-like protein [Leptotrombidium deliense]